MAYVILSTNYFDDFVNVYQESKIYTSKEKAERRFEDMVEHVLADTQNNYSKEENFLAVATDCDDLLPEKLIWLEEINPLSQDVPYFIPFLIRDTGSLNCIEPMSLSKPTTSLEKANGYILDAVANELDIDEYHNIVQDLEEEGASYIFEDTNGIYGKYGVNCLDHAYAIVPLTKYFDEWW